MAVSSATTIALTICISQRDPSSEFSLLTPKSSSTLSSYSVKLPSKKISFVIRSSADWTPPETTNTTTTTTDVDKSSSVESTKVSYSLISTINVEKILRGIAITDADHYARLGIQRGCPYDQVTVAYKNKCEELRSQEGLEEEKLNQKLELIKESHYILSTEEERRMYDWSLARTGNTEKYMWPFEADITQIQTRMPPPREPEDFCLAHTFFRIELCFKRLLEKWNSLLPVAWLHTSECIYI